MTTPDDEGPFFIGYLKTPPKLALFYAVLVPIVAGIAIGAGIGFAASQRDPGQGGFQRGYQTVTGILVNEPYPTLYAFPDEENPAMRAVVLTGPGKVGALPRTENLDRQVVDVGGVYIARGAHRILQVGGRVGVRPTQKELSDAERALGLAKTESLGRYTLKGEIVDSKCYLGAMRPGDGKIHMACANYCLHGGIAPVFVTYMDDDVNGETFIYLLAGPDGRAIDPALLDYTSLAVSLEGEVERRGDLYVFKVGADSVETL